MPEKQHVIRVPAGHPDATELRSLMDLLATEVRVGEQSVRRPGFDGSAEMMLDALRRAGYAKQVDRAIHVVRAEAASVSPSHNDDVAMGTMCAMLQAQLGDAVSKSSKDRVEEMVFKTMDDLRRG